MNLTWTSLIKLLESTDGVNSTVVVNTVQRLKTQNKQLLSHLVSEGEAQKKKHYENEQNSMKEKARALGKKIVGVTSDVMSHRARRKARKSGETADYEVGIIKKNREIGTRPPRHLPATHKGLHPDDDRHVASEYRRIKKKYDK